MDSVFQKPNLSERTGLVLLLLSLPLLLWQAIPANQAAIMQHDFLSVHSLMEVFAVVVAALIFFTTFGTGDIPRSKRVVVLGCLFLATALFDIMHLLSYGGMPDFISANNGPNKSILFWLCGRLAAGIGMLAYILMAESHDAQRGWAGQMLLAIFVLVGAVAYMVLFHTHDLPAMFVVGEGLTPIKVALEWSVFGLYLVTAVILYRKRHQVVNCDVNSLLLALLLMAAGELFFTVYVRVSSTANLLGHIYKVMAYYYLYRAIFSETVRQPFRQISKMLAHDDLTGLASRAAFNAKLQQAIARVQKSGGACAVLLMGLDRFKTVNATLGHERGDLLLMAVAERISAALPAATCVARFSGDSFLILLEAVDIQRARLAGAALLAAMREEFNLGTDRLEMGASLGVVMYPDDGDSASELLRHADVSLQRAKTEGRHRMVVFSQALGEEIERRVLIESCMKQALERHEFALHYQPKVNLSSGRIVAWEALLRWQSPQLGFMSPVEFIPVAEESGLIHPIGEWVLTEACRRVAAWQAMGLDSGSVAVNLSTRQFRQKNLPEKIAAIMREAGIPANRLTLEITESAIMDDPVSASTMLARLAQLGVYTAVDDFGTGYSSLSYLKTFPVDCLKIDRSFICDIPASADDGAIVRAIVGMSHSLGLRVVAEGVETEDQLEYLRAEGCDEIQGYLFSRPLPPDDCVVLMQSGKQLAAAAASSRIAAH